ncbi:NADPH-dependent F420 reductase [Naasia sp. SYSU D00948]|uniref:NADPH-dependent F420 reductase n=1 Tax=Naasia sp. SYSU D00948 TaxID=2817379 RepID=UPI001B3125B3|nr:NADPH-dependent F420 reductase [Naasia sp. SYSU D00948]
MASVSIIGTGKIGSALAGVAQRAGAEVQLIAHSPDRKASAPAGIPVGVVGDDLTGDIVILAVPYAGVDNVLTVYSTRLVGKVVVDVTNPVDLSSLDRLVVPPDSSAAAQIAAKVPDAKVVKAFNTTFAATLESGRTGDAPTTVLVAGDDPDAKSAVLELARGAGLRAVDVGSLKRARELESLGFLEIALAVTEKTSWAGGFALTR